jgi:hypothetical protein
VKLGISGIIASLAIATGCAGSAGISCEVHAPGTPEPVYIAPGETELVLTPSTGMPSGYDAPQQSFAGVLEPGRVTR